MRWLGRGLAAHHRMQTLSKTKLLMFYTKCASWALPIPQVFESWKMYSMWAVHFAGIAFPVVKFGLHSIGGRP